MKTEPSRMALRTLSWVGVGALLHLASAPASAQNQRYYPQAQGGYPQQAPVYPQQVPSYPQQPQYAYPQQGYQQPAPGYGSYPQQQPQKRFENPIEFLPKFGKRMSEMVRRVFYGQDSGGGWEAPPPGGNYSLDSSPRQYPNTAPSYPQQPSYQYPQQSQPQAPGQVQQPRYNYPPQQQAPVNPSSSRTPQPLPPASRNSAPQSAPQSKPSTRSYTPPKVNDSPPKTSTRSSATTSRPKETVASKPPAPTPTPSALAPRRSEVTPREQPASNPSSSSSSSSSTSSLGSGSFLKGKKTAKPGRVISPYPPFKELDITGLESGSLALDPTTQKVFEVP